MTVVCDASPLIFLAKLDRLTLLQELLGGTVVVLRCVAEEVLSEGTGVLERQRLNDFFPSVEIVEGAESSYGSKALSRCDCQTLTYAVAHSAEWLVADDRLLRRVAIEEGMRVIGVLGLLIGAVRKGLITPDEDRADIDAVVTCHGLRISVALYRRLMSELGS